MHEQQGDTLTYYFKDGTIKAQGAALHGVMQGEWKFYRATGQLWQMGNFYHGKKNGHWIRFNKLDEMEYEAIFENGKIQKKATPS